MRSRTAIGGNEPSGSLLGIHKYTPSNSVLIPPDEPPFERFNLSETMRDIGAVIGVSLFLSVTALALSVGVFVLMFVEVH